ncbi:MAG: hypothetical protein QM778_05470 [Myxococcales bacterium]
MSTTKHLRPSFVSPLPLRGARPFTSLAALILGLGGWAGTASAAPDALGRAEQLAQGKGASAERLVEKHGKLAKNAGQTVSLKLASKQCVVAAASVDEAVPDVTLSLEVKGGPTLADDASGPNAAIRYCSGTADEKLTVRLHSEQAAHFALGVWGVVSTETAVAPATQAAGVAQDSTKASPADAAKPVPPQPSPSKRVQNAAAKRAAGLAAMTPVREEDVSADSPRKREVVLAADQCYRVLSATDSADSELELTLIDPKGSVVATARGKSEVALPDAQNFCPKQGGAHALTLRTSVGTARAAWQLFGGPNPELEARWPVGGKGDALVATRMRDIHRNQGAKAAAMAFENGQLATNDVHTSHFEVVGGRCYLAVAAGVPSLRALELEVLDQRGNTVARAQEQNSINMQRVCADVSGTWTLRAKAFKGYGAFGVQVFVAPSP